MIFGKTVILREKNLDDARDDYLWEIDPELAHLDAAPSKTTITFSQYLLDYADEVRNPSITSRRLAVDTFDGRHIGNCSYYGINQTRSEAELGIMIGNRDYWDKGYGTDVVTTLVDYIFRNIGLNRIYLKTLDFNKRAHRCFGKCGFTYYGHLKRDGFSFTLMELHRKTWEQRISTEGKAGDEC